HDAVEEVLGAQGAGGDEVEHPGVVGGGHAVAAEQVELPGDGAVQGYAGAAVDGREEADLHVASSTAQAEDGVGARGFAAHGVDGDVGSSPGEVAHGGGDVAAVDEQGVLGAGATGGVQGCGVAVDGDDVRATGGGDHDGTEPDAAGAEHDDLLPWCEPRAPGDGAVGGGEPAAEARGGLQGDVVGDGDEVGVGGVQHDELGVRAPVGEAGLGLIGADLGLPGAAPVAGAAPADE